MGGKQSTPECSAIKLSDVVGSNHRRVNIGGDGWLHFHTTYSKSYGGCLLNKPGGGTINMADCSTLGSNVSTCYVHDINNHGYRLECPYIQSGAPNSDDYGNCTLVDENRVGS